MTHDAARRSQVIVVSVLFCCVGVLTLYCSLARQDALSRHIFSMEQRFVDKATFFVLIILAATVNVRLAALLPYTDRRSTAWRNVALRRILSLHTASKVVEDLPQLVLAGVFLVHTSAAADLSVSDSGAVGAAIVQLLVSGVSFVLTLLWLGLQIADSHRPTPLTPKRGPTPTSPPQWPTGMAGERRRSSLFGGGSGVERSQTSGVERSTTRRGPARNFVQVETVQVHRGPDHGGVKLSEEVSAGGAAGDGNDDSSAMKTDISTTEHLVAERV